MMKRWILSGVVALTSAGLAQAATGRANLSGVYSSVRYIEEAGDLAGMEIELHDGPRPTALVTSCEGTCYGGKTWPVKISGSRLSFTVENEGLGPTHYVGVVRGSTMILRAPASAYDDRERLRRVPRPKPGQTAELACPLSGC